MFPHLYIAFRSCQADEGVELHIATHHFGEWAGESQWNLRLQEGIRNFASLKKSVMDRFVWPRIYACCPWRPFRTWMRMHRTRCQLAT